MKRISIVLLIMIASSTGLYAQDDTYSNAIGIRLGPSTPAVKSGITYRRSLNNNKAIEGILGFGDGLSICGLYEIFKPLAAENLQWFIGFGGYAGFTDKVTNIGAAGIIGLDYNFPNIPLNLSLDWKPELNLIEKIGFEASTVGFSVRYRF
jgi:hypothetical protein